MFRIGRECRSCRCNVCTCSNYKSSKCQKGNLLYSQQQRVMRKKKTFCKNSHVSPCLADGESDVRMQKVDFWKEKAAPALHANPLVAPERSELLLQTRLTLALPSGLDGLQPDNGAQSGSSDWTSLWEGGPDQIIHRLKSAHPCWKTYRDIAR